MAENKIDLDPVSHITIDAIGKPGKRVFYIQAQQDFQVITLLVEKVQIQTLAIGIEEFLKEIHQRFEELPETSGDYEEEKMHIQPPVDPLFRVSEFGLAYDSSRDVVILVARESAMDEQNEENGGVIQFWCTRSQVHALARWGLEISTRGRPLCPQCREPMDPEGHFCPKKNGHKP